MSVKHQISRFPAAILGFVGFLSSFVVLAVMVFVTWGVLHRSLHEPDIEELREVQEVEGVQEFVQRPSHPDEITMAVVCFPLAVAFGVIVYRVLRSPPAPNILFQTSFFAGLALLCYSLWVALASYRTLLLLADDSLRLSGPASTLLVCIVTIPGALILMVFAVLSDRTPCTRSRRSSF